MGSVTSDFVGHYSVLCKRDICCEKGFISKVLFKWCPWIFIFGDKEYFKSMKHAKKCRPKRRRKKESEKKYINTWYAYSATIPQRIYDPERRKPLPHWIPKNKHPVTCSALAHAETITLGGSQGDKVHHTFSIVLTFRVVRSLPIIHLLLGIQQLVYAHTFVVGYSEVSLCGTNWFFLRFDT